MLLSEAKRYSVFDLIEKSWKQLDNEEAIQEGDIVCLMKQDWMIISSNGQSVFYCTKVKLNDGTVTNKYTPLDSVLDQLEPKTQSLIRQNYRSIYR